MPDVLRDDKGRFVEGTYSPNPGGSSLARIAYRQSLEEAVSEQDFKEVVGVLLVAAKAGKPWAVKEFFDLILGRDFNLRAQADPRDVEIHELIAGFKSKSQCD